MTTLDIDVFDPDRYVDGVPHDDFGAAAAGAGLPPPRPAGARGSLGRDPARRRGVRLAAPGAVLVVGAHGAADRLPRRRPRQPAADDAQHRPARPLTPAHAGQPG